MNFSGHNNMDRWVALAISVTIHLVVITVFFAFWNATVPEQKIIELELASPVPAKSMNVPGLPPENTVGTTAGTKRTEQPEVAPVQKKDDSGVVPKPSLLTPTLPAGTEKQVVPAPQGAEISGDGAPSGMALAPPRLRERPVPFSPATAVRAGVTRAVLLTVEILEDGSVGKIVVSRSSGSTLFDGAARENIAGWRFDPARLPQGGKPVRVLTAVWMQ